VVLRVHGSSALNRISVLTSPCSTSRSRRRRSTPAAAATRQQLDQVSSTDLPPGAGLHQAAGMARCRCRAGWERLVTSTRWCWKAEVAAMRSDKRLYVTRLYAVVEDASRQSICRIPTSCRCELTSQPAAHIASFSSTKVSHCALQPR